MSSTSENINSNHSWDCTVCYGEHTQNEQGYGHLGESFPQRLPEESDAAFNGRTVRMIQDERKLIFHHICSDCFNQLLQDSTWTPHPRNNLFDCPSCRQILNTQRFVNLTPQFRLLDHATGDEQTPISQQIEELNLDREVLQANIREILEATSEALGAFNQPQLQNTVLPVEEQLHLNLWHRVRRVYETIGNRIGYQNLYFLLNILYTGHFYYMTQSRFERDPNIVVDAAIYVISLFHPIPPNIHYHELLSGMALLSHLNFRFLRNRNAPLSQFIDFAIYSASNHLLRLISDMPFITAPDYLNRCLQAHQRLFSNIFFLQCICSYSHTVDYLFEVHRLPNILDGREVLPGVMQMQEQQLRSAYYVSIAGMIFGMIAISLAVNIQQWPHERDLPREDGVLFSSSVSDVFWALIYAGGFRFLQAVYNDHFS